jgi:ankyrin repeat protein
MVNLLLKHAADSLRASKNPFSGEDSTWTALHVLPHVGQDDPRLVGLILQRRSPIDGFPDNFFSTESPLLVALQNNAFKLAESLISHGADINFTTTSSNHLTLAQPTTILGHVIATNARNPIARVRYLLGTASLRDRLDFIVEPAPQWTLLHRAAAAHINTEFRDTNETEASGLRWTDSDWGANREIANELLRHDGSTEQLNAVEQSEEHTAMHLAVLAGNEAVVCLLLEHGARIDVPNAAGETATALALRLQMECLVITKERFVLDRREIAARKRLCTLLNKRVGERDGHSAGNERNANAPVLN